MFGHQLVDDSRALRILCACNCGERVVDQFFG
jgi:hypothetical protein